jgi:hypothetical protein
VGAIAPLTGQALSDLDATLQVKVRGTFSCLRRELTVMLGAGRGAIVNNASLAGLVGSPDNAVYDASKHAVVGLTRSAGQAFDRWPHRDCPRADDQTVVGKGLLAAVGVTEPDLIRRYVVASLPRCRAVTASPSPPGRRRCGGRGPARRLDDALGSGGRERQLLCTSADPRRLTGTSGA